MTNFSQAAASYFGIDLARTAEAVVLSDERGMELQVRIVLSDEDIIWVTERMKQLAASAPVDALPVDVVLAPVSDALLRDEYKALLPALRSYYGSFLRYKSARLSDTLAPDDEPQEEKGVLPPYVWLDPKNCTEDQIACPLGAPHPVTGKIAIGVDQLTDDQRAEWAMGVARGAKP